MSRNKLRILHVSDSFNAGVQHGIENMVNQFPQYEHLLLWAAHSDSPSPEIDYLNEVFHSSWYWRGGFVNKYFQLNKLIASQNVDLIHLHSSVAGVIGRLIPSSVPKMYSPHCFAFQRKDISFLYRFFFLLAEFLLANRKSLLALCWPIEIEIAKKYLRNSSIVFMPIIDLRKFEDVLLKPKKEGSKILCVGRIRPQKDPEFLTLATQFEPMLSSKIVWIGSGDLKLKLLLTNAKIHVIAWMKKDEIWAGRNDYIASCIPSSWESGPLTLFESLSVGMPVICRSIPALDIYGFLTFQNPKDFARAVRNVVESDKFRSDLYDHQIKTVIETFKRLSLKYSEQDPYSRIITKYEE
jgi:glycosyltransferase involved in cell wall biosynthesis